MKKSFFLYVLSTFLLITSCSKDSDNEIQENSVPIIYNHNFEVDENVEENYSVGFVNAKDADGDVLLYKMLSTNLPFSINKNTGEITVSGSQLIDFEKKSSYLFKIEVTDGGSKVQTEINITVNDVSEIMPIADDIEMYVEYFKYMALNKNRDIPLTTTIKWTGEMKIFLSGNFTQVDKETISGFINSINALTTDEFYVSLVSSIEESNVEIYFETFEGLQINKPDFIDNPKESFSGLASPTFSSSNKNILSANIWINTASYNMTTLMHEILHVIGFGHSDEASSILFPSSLVTELSDHDKFIIKMLYHPLMKPNYTEEQIDEVLHEILMN